MSHLTVKGHTGGEKTLYSEREREGRGQPMSSRSSAYSAGAPWPDGWHYLLLTNHPARPVSTPWAPLPMMGMRTDNMASQRRHWWEDERACVGACVYVLGRGVSAEQSERVSGGRGAESG